MGEESAKDSYAPMANHGSPIDPLAGDNASIAVLGLGNLLYGDEGVGIHALHMLRTRLDPTAGIAFLDGGVAGLDLLPVVESCSHLLILDAADASMAPGSVIERRGEDLLHMAGVCLSEHQLSFQSVLGIAHFRGLLPEHLHLLGVQPAALQPGTSLSAPVQGSLMYICQRAGEILDNWKFE